MGQMKFIMTIDMEEDNPWQKPGGTQTLNSGCIHRFQQLCDRYHFKPTYLCSSEMVKCKTFQEFISPVLEGEKAEIGAHLHPWRCPPMEDITGQDYKYLPHPHEYPDKPVKMKMHELTRSIKDYLGVLPKSYRAGRWGLGIRHIPILEELEYGVDSSVTPTRPIQTPLFCGY